MKYHRFFFVLVLIISVVQISGCSHPKQTESRRAAITNQIYSHDEQATEYEEMGNTEMAQYHREKTHEAREEYTNENTDLIDILIIAIFDNFLDSLFD